MTRTIDKTLLDAFTYQQERLTSDRVSTTVLFLGRAHDPRDQRDWLPSRMREEQIAYIDDELHAGKIKRVTSPYLVFSADIVDSVDPSKAPVSKGSFSELLRLRMHPKADGVFLKPGEAAYLTSGDCPTVVVSVPKLQLVVAMHCGLKTLYDSASLIYGDGSARTFPSIIRALQSKLWILTRTDWKDVSARIYLGIGMPNYEIYNRSFGSAPEQTQAKDVVRYFQNHYEKALSISYEGPDILSAKVSIETLIRLQFEEIGVPGDHVTSDGIDPYDREAWFSHRRWTKTDRTHPDGRNGVLVMHHV